MMPLALANVGEENIIKRIGGNPEMKHHLADAEMIEVKHRPQVLLLRSVFFAFSPGRRCQRS